MNCANHPDIPAVAYCRTCGKPLCANCTRSVQGVIYCETCLADRLHEVPQDRSSFGRVRYLGVKLHAVERQPRVPDRGERAGVRAGERREVGRLAG